MAGIPVSMSVTTLLVAAFIGFSLAPTTGTVGAVLATFAFFLSILAHEFGHALMARRFGVGTPSIHLWALGGVAQLDRRPPSPGAQAAIAVAGPAVSLLLGVSAVAATLVVPYEALAWVGVINVILAVFNMLPGTPLDGGHVVEALRWKMTGSRSRGARDAALAGVVLGLLVVGLGVALVVSGSPAFLTVLVGGYLVMASRAAARNAVVESRLDGRTVADVTVFGLAAFDEAYDADDVLAQRDRIGASGVFVVTSQGQMTGVGEVSLLASTGDLASTVLPIGELGRVELSADLLDALDSLIGLPVSRRPVLVWDAGNLVGVLDNARLSSIALAEPDPVRVPLSV